MNYTYKVHIYILIFGAFFSCTNYNEEDYFSNTPCDSTYVNRDTMEVVYNDLDYIFTGICMSCHNSVYTERQGINFDSYENVVSSINTGKVIPAIKHETVIMPQGRAKLSDCEIQRIEVWVERNMPK